MALRIVRPNYLPAGSDERNKWLQTFASTLPQYAGPLGLSPTQLAGVQNDAAQYQYLMQTLIPYARAFSVGLTALLEEADSDSTPQPLLYPAFSPPGAPTPAVESGIFNRVVSLVDDVISRAPGLTPAIKTALKLDPIAPSAPGAVAIREAVALPDGQVNLILTRSGAALLIIESRRGSEADFSLLDKIAASHYLDLRPNATPGQSEVREYRIRRSDGSAAVGDYSASVRVATQA